MSRRRHEAVPAVMDAAGDVPDHAGEHADQDDDLSAWELLQEETSQLRAADRRKPRRPRREA